MLVTDPLHHYLTIRIVIVNVIFLLLLLFFIVIVIVLDYLTILILQKQSLTDQFKIQNFIANYIGSYALQNPFFFLLVILAAGWYILGNPNSLLENPTFLTVSLLVRWSRNAVIAVAGTEG